jgi:hypothetical protein
MFLDRSKEDLATANKDDSSQIPEVPPSWVSKIELSKEDMEMRYPKGTKILTYKDAQVEYFAEYKMSSGIVKRISLLKDQQVIE